MYGKLFATMYDGTLGTRGPWQALVTFQQLVILADRHGVVDMTSEAIARRTTIPIDIITKGLAMLEQPDPDSRSPDEDGRRIVRLSDTRAWGWRIVNHGKYRAMRTQEERREYHRQYWHKRRGAQPDSTDSTTTQQTQPIAVSSKQDAVDPNPLSGEVPDDTRSGRRSGEAKERRREAYAMATRAIAHLNKKAGTRFQPVEANLKLPAARVLYDGASEADLLAVVDVKAAETTRGEFDRKYLRPATLWRAEKFAQYLGQVNAQAPAAANPRERMKVYADYGAGELEELEECAPGRPEDVARRVLAQYRGAPRRSQWRNIVTKVNGAQSRFSVAELGQ